MYSSFECDYSFEHYIHNVTFIIIFDICLLLNKNVAAQLRFVFSSLLLTCNVTE